MRHMRERCPVCGRECQYQEYHVDVFQGSGPTCEESVVCTDGHYVYEFSYGHTVVSVGQQTWEWSWLDQGHRYKRYEIQAAVAYLKGQLGYAGGCMYQRTELRRVWDAGCFARHQGKGLADNPWSNSARRQAWIDGWNWYKNMDVWALGRDAAWFMYSPKVG